jgi:DNA helicase-2/ATP-dependent DNA helicase PcrA
MTLHLAKGLEFDTVFLLGMEEGMLPHSRSVADKSQVEEERRLCYVGITRAKKSLYISRSIVRSRFGAGNFSGKPSRFISEMPRECIAERGQGFFNYF